jgi:hypothetical protein
MTEKNGYGEWADHPRWKELEAICHDIEKLKDKAEDLRTLIQKEVYG